MSEHADFIVFPAIDLRGGQVVRLKEGDPDRQTSYSPDPAGTARRWISAGARWLHVVNLDGAFGLTGGANERAARAILAEAGRAGVPVQFGGGLRTLEAVEAILALGAARAVLGTLAIEQPGALAEALSRWGAERVSVSLDARDGRVQTHGWQSDTPILARELVVALRETGLRWLVFTDIARDGLQTGLNMPATLELARASGLRVIASGGIRGLEDVRQAREAGLAGAIVGRALYEGAIEPQQLFRWSNDRSEEKPC
jgi:phosphoribosylformimino-5-aminoimidazole carboxamide ribotide isomerase